MGEWQVVGISFMSGDNGYWMTKTAWQNIANVIGGEVKTAEQWGFTAINSLPRTYNISTLPIYRHDSECPYGIICCGYRASNTPSLYIVPMTGGEVTARVYNGGFYYYNITNIRVFAGDGFSILSTLADTSYPSIWGFDTYHDEVNDRDFLGLFNRDMEVLSMLNGSLGSNAVNGKVQSQNDGSLYVEIVKHIGIQISNSIAQNVFVSEHLYNRYYAYNASDKNVVMNGIRFTNPQGSLVYFPTE